MPPLWAVLAAYSNVPLFSIGWHTCQGMIPSPSLSNVHLLLSDSRLQVTTTEQSDADDMHSYGTGAENGLHSDERES